MERFSRTALLLGDEGMERLKNAHVLVFGLGGVGSYAVEALARAGIGRLTIVDSDEVSETNINRQLIALSSTVGRHKTEVTAARIAEINPDCAVTAVREFFTPETAENWDLSRYDYIADAIDTVKSKLFLASAAQEMNIPIISCMGMGNRLDATKITVSDISKTQGDGLARTMRKELRARGVKKLKCVWSTEEAIKASADEALPEGCSRRSLPGSVSFVPGAAGLIMAGEIIKDIAKVI